MTGFIVGLPKAGWYFCVARTSGLHSIRDYMLRRNRPVFIYRVDDLYWHATLHHLRRGSFSISSVYGGRCLFRRLRSQRSHRPHPSNHSKVIRQW